MSNTVQKSVLAVAGVAALALGGSALAGAATSHSTSGSSARSAQSGQTPPANMPAHGTAAHEDAEKPVTGDAAAKAQAAAVKSVGSGTAGDVTTDMPGTGFETTVTKADGTKVEVHLDSSFKVMTGGPGGRGHGGPPPTGSAPQGAPGYGG